MGNPLLNLFEYRVTSQRHLLGLRSCDKPIEQDDDEDREANCSRRSDGDGRPLSLYLDRSGYKPSNRSGHECQRDDERSLLKASRTGNVVAAEPEQYEHSTSDCKS